MYAVWCTMDSADVTGVGACVARTVPVSGWSV